MDSQRAKTVVIGAGPAGLATAAQLRRRGVPVLVLERAGAVGSSWRGRYDRLRLNSSRPFSKLPGARYPAGTPMFPSRDQVVAYLEDYARENELEIRFRTRVERLEPHGGGWCLETDHMFTPSAHLKRLTIMFAGGEEQEDFDLALQALDDGRIDGTPWLGPTVGLSGVRDALEGLANPDNPIRVLVDPRQP